MNPAEVLRDVVARYFKEEDRFVEAVKRGETALERGDSLTHEQVGDRLRRFLKP
jgi:predicted transcriptional regulator